MLVGETSLSLSLCVTKLVFSFVFSVILVMEIQFLHYKNSFKGESIYFFKGQ